MLGNTYDLDAADFAKIRRDTTDRKLAGRVGDPVIPSTAGYGDPHKFAVDAITPPVTIPGSATVKTARTQYWPALKDLSMYSLRMREDGCANRTGIRSPPSWATCTVDRPA